MVDLLFAVEADHLLVTLLVMVVMVAVVVADPDDVRVVTMSLANALATATGLLRQQAAVVPVAMAHTDHLTVFEVTFEGWVRRHHAETAHHTGVDDHHVRLLHLHLAWLLHLHLAWLLVHHLRLGRLHRVSRLLLHHGLGVNHRIASLHRLLLLLGHTRLLVHYLGLSHHRLCSLAKKRLLVWRNLLAKNDVLIVDLLA